MKQAIRVAINNNAEVSQDDSGSASFFVGGGCASHSWGDYGFPRTDDLASAVHELCACGSL